MDPKGTESVRPTGHTLTNLLAPLPRYGGVLARVWLVISAMAGLLAGCVGDAKVVDVLEPTSKIQVTAPTTSMLPGDSVQLSAAALDATGRELDRPITWASSDTTVATVSATGLVSGRVTGSATIEASYEHVVGSVDVTILDPCAGARLYTISATVEGSLTAADCQLPNGTAADYYTVSVNGAQIGAVVTATAASFAPVLTLRDGADVAVAMATPAASPAEFRAILANGNYQLEVTSAAPATGAYTLTSRLETAPITGCAEVWVTRPVSLTDSVTVGDCTTTSADGTTYSDHYLIHLTEGDILVVQLTSADFDALVNIRDATGAVIATDDNSGGSSDALLSFTAPQEAIYTIEATTAGVGSVGRYTMDVLK